MIVSDTKFGASLTDDTGSVNYDCNVFIIQATGKVIQLGLISPIFYGVKAGQLLRISFLMLLMA
jgi:hypothetical protein